MDAADLVAQRFTDILDRKGESAEWPFLTDCDRMIWCIVRARCAREIDGFESVFDQCLTEEELLFLISSLARLGEPALAGAYERAHAALRRAGFFDMAGALCHELGPELEAELSEVEKLVDFNEAMWRMDSKLAGLFDKTDLPTLPDRG